MTTSSPVRPRVSRETRRLLAAAALALVTLWVLARIRFPDRTPSANPVVPVLNQIAPPPGFPDLAAEVERIGRRILPVIATIESSDRVDGDNRRVIPAWPLPDGLAVAVLPSSQVVRNRGSVAAADTISGLRLVRTATSAAGVPGVWRPERLNRPRYVIAVAPAPRSPSLLPTYLSSLEPEQSVAWSGEVWVVPGALGLTAGSLIFTSGGEWLGISADDGSRLVIVPADTLLRRSDELRSQTAPAADLGLSVQSLSADIAASTGAAAGVIVTWVDPRGPSAGTILVGDVIEAVDGHAVPTVLAWRARTGRVARDAPIRLHIRRNQVAVDVSVKAAAGKADQLGLTLARSGAGSRVVRVAAGSAAESAGLLPGDVLTAIGASAELTPGDLERQFEALKPADTLLLSVTRGNDHHIAVLTR